MNADLCSSSYIRGWRAGYRRCCGRRPWGLYVVWAVSGLLLGGSMLVTAWAFVLASENGAIETAKVRGIGKWEAWNKVRGKR